MRRFLRIFGCIVWWLLMASLVVCLYAFFFSNGPQPIRFDLLRVPQGAPPAQPGFPTFLAAGLFWKLGLVDVIDIQDVPVPGDVVLRKDVEYGCVPNASAQGKPAAAQPSVAGNTASLATASTPPSATGNTAPLATVSAPLNAPPTTDCRKLLLDLYSPQKLAHAAPCLIFIHGGGWSSGDKKDYAYYAVRFAQRGYVVASVGYRFVQEAKMPACIEDVKCAVRYLRSHAAEYNIDPEKLAAIGGSAGGHLSLMLGLAPDQPALEGQGGWAGVSSKVAAVVDLYGPTDLTLPLARTNRTVTNAIGKSYEEAPQMYEMISPITYLTPNAPPILILQGNIDHIVPVSQSDLLAEKLKRMGLPYWYDCVYGMPHTMDIILRTNEHCEFVMNAFFDKYLKGQAVEVVEGGAR